MMVWIVSPASDTWSGRMRGMPPATAASKYKRTPPSAAAAKTSAPWRASSSLLAVTRGLPERRVDMASSRVGSVPPMTSTTTSMSGWVIASAALSVRRFLGTTAGRGRVVSETRMVATSIWTPHCEAMRSDCAFRSSSNAVPTVPQPNRATLQLAGGAASEVITLG